jgi:hypothetical protein
MCGYRRGRTTGAPHEPVRLIGYGGAGFPRHQPKGVVDSTSVLGSPKFREDTMDIKFYLIGSMLINTAWIGTIVLLLWKYSPT